MFLSLRACWKRKCVFSNDDFRVVDKGDGTYINISQNQRVNEKIKKLIGLTNLDALYLTEKEIENIFEFTMLVDD